MKVTKRKNGSMMVNLKMTFALDAAQIATHVTSRLMNEPKFDQEPGIFANLVLATYKERALMKIVQDSIEYDGLETPSYRVGDSHKNDHCEALASRLRQRFNLS